MRWNGDREESSAGRSDPYKRVVWVASADPQIRHGSVEAMKAGSSLPSLSLLMSWSVKVFHPNSYSFLAGMLG